MPARLPFFTATPASVRRRLRGALAAMLLGAVAACGPSTGGPAPGPGPGAPAGGPAPGAQPPQARFAPIAPPEPANVAGLRAPPPDFNQPAPAVGAAPAPRADGKTRVAMLLPLSGPQAALGRAMQEAAQLALFTLADDQFELIFEDTGGRPQQAAQAAQGALSKGAGLLLGPLLSTSVRAVGPVARRAGVNVVAFTTDRTVAGSGIFVMGLLPRAEIERVVAHAAAQGMQRFAALAPRTAYGEIALSEFNRAVAQVGRTIVGAELYDPQATDFNTLVRGFITADARAAQLNAQRQALGAASDAASQRTQAALGASGGPAAGFDALFVPDGAGGSLLALAPFLNFHGVTAPKVRLLGTGLWDDPATLAEPSLQGGWFAAPEPDQRGSFERDFREAYGQRPHRLATLAYDAAALAAVLARTPQGDRFGPAAISDPAGFVGVDGIFRFTADGVVQRGFAVLEVAPNGGRVVSRAPTTFQAMGN